MTRNQFAYAVASVVFVASVVLVAARPERSLVPEVSRATTASQAWGHWTVAEGVMPDGQTVVQFTLGLIEAQGWHVRSVSSRQTAQGALFDIFATAAPVAPSSSPYGASCPGHPTAPFPGATCYADGGWR